MPASAAPRLEMRPVGVAQRDGDAWLVNWSIVAHEPLGARLIGVVLPHSQFRTEMARSDLLLREGVPATITLRVRVTAEPATEIENAFVIATVEHASQQWRFLARIRVRLSPTGVPSPQLEAMTTQRVGFSAAV